ncbi:hypothetical protein LCGC14_0392030 [marine sediment metagenome]|uniref:Uncharacterized protein n=1 Tax=marine sediment metagenome TaxID=412755 RepID=A0A0F9T547_9ZZZZ
MDFEVSQDVFYLLRLKALMAGKHFRCKGFTLTTTKGYKVRVNPKLPRLTARAISERGQLILNRIEKRAQRRRGG